MSDTVKPRIKNASMRPETHKRLKRIAKTRKWSIMDTLDLAVETLDRQSNAQPVSN